MTTTATPTATPEPVIYGDEPDHLKARLTCGHYSRDIFDRSSTWDFTHEEQECPHGCPGVFFTQEVQDRANAPEPVEARIAAAIAAQGVHPLTAAYHAIYDTKDAAAPGSPVFYQAYLTLQALATLMAAEGVPVPERFDAAR